MAVTAAGTPYVESSDNVADYPGVSLALANHIDGLDIGKVLQVVSETKTDTFSTSSSSFVDLTGLTATLTPSSTSSKVLINVVIYFGASVDNTSAKFNLLRGSTNIAQPSGGSELATAFGGSITAAAAMTAAPISFLDSPATDSAVTYKIQAAAASATIYVNRGNNANRTSISTITLMEISA